jgi:enhancing lycopene biosynthesis protein 2
MATTRTSTRTSRASRTSTSKPAAAKTTKPATKPASPAQAKPTMTPTVWRSDPKRAQLNDQQIVAALKEFAKEHSSQPIGAVSNWSDARIISLIGWTDTLNGALKKLRPLVAAKAA